MPSLMNKKLLLIFLSAAAVLTAVFRIATRHGIGLSPDSVVYVAAARNIAAGKGITTPTAIGLDLPLTHFPPAYPVLLSVLARWGVPQFFIALKLLNLALYLVLIGLIGRWVYLRSGGSVWLTLCAGALAMTSVDLLRVYTMAWSETLFLVLTVGALELLSLHVERSSSKSLVGAAVLTAVAWLTRYAGVAAFVASLIVLALNPRENLKQKMRSLLLFYGIAGLPMAAWLLRNTRLTHHATTRIYTFHPLFGDLLRATQSSLSLWLFQQREPSTLATLIGVMALGFFVILWRRYGKKLTASPDLPLLLVYAACYAGLIAVTVFLFEADLLVPDEFDRILAPLHIALLLAALTAFSQEKWPPGLRKPLTAGAVVGMVYFGFMEAREIRGLAEDGQQYASRIWRASPTIEYIQRLPPSMHVYTNGTMPVYLYANRSCFEIPPRTIISSLLPNPNFEKYMRGIRDEVRRGAAVVVYFDEEARPQFPASSELKDYFHAAGIKMQDGFIIRT